MFAYFIGGPWDLTKRAAKVFETTVYAPVLMDSKLLAHNPSPMQVVEVVRHNYRRYFTQGEAVIYIYEGVS